MADKNFRVKNGLEVGGTEIDIAQGTTIEYSENNNRLNRPTVQSTTGNSSGLRVSAPNATTSASAGVAAFSTNDDNNGKFLSIQARGDLTTPLRIQTGQYTSGVLSATTDLINFVDGTTVYATVNPNGIINNTDLATKLYVDNSDTNTTYAIDAASTTGGANFNLTSSDATTDTIKFSSAGSTTVSQVNANEIQISSVDTNTTYTQNASVESGGAGLNLVGSDATTDTVKFAGGTNVTVTATDANTITIAAIDTNTTYTIDASSTTGGANLNLVGSDATTDTIKFSGSGATTVAQTSANEITISSTDTNTTYTQDASTTTGGANVNLVGSDSTTDTIKYAGAGSVSVVATDANTVTITGTDTNTTYDFAATSTAGGANLNLTGSDATTDTVKISSGTGVSVAQISGTEVSVAIGQSVGTGDTPSFAGVSAGNLTVGVATDNTIASTNTNGNIVVDPNGTGEIVLSSITRALGEIQATTNLNYTFPASTLNTVTDNNGYSAASSFPAGTNGYGANAGFQHYYGDTLAGNNTSPAFSFRNANGNSVTGDTVPFTGLVSVAPSATLINQVMGTLNFNGYGTTGFTNDVASQYQGGGINSLHALQTQSYPTESFSDSTLTLTSTRVTAVASSFRAALVAPSVVGTRGQIQFNTTTPAVGAAIRVTGTLTGTATGIVSGQTYYVIVTNGTTTATLSATPGGSPITTTAGTLTGLTLTRCGVTFTMSGLTSVPFGRGALVTVSGVTNITDGTYPVVGTPTTTSMLMGIPHTVAPTVAGAQVFSCLTSYAGSGFRIRAVPLATPLNFQNRLEMLDMTPAATVIRSNTVTFNTGAYGNTGGLLPGGNISYRRTHGCFHKVANVTAAAANTVYNFDWFTDTSVHVGNQGVTVTAGNPTRVVIDTAGRYTAFVEMQVKNTVSANRIAWIWLARNGTDIAETRIKVEIKQGGGTDAYQLINKLWLLENIAANDYIEMRFAVDNASGISFEYEAAQTTPFVMPAQPSATLTIVPVGA